VAHRGQRDAWLFLTPEVERDGAPLVERLTGDAGLARRAEALVRDGDAAGWFAYLRECRRLLEQVRDEGADPDDCLLLALILREQYLLAPGVPGLTAQDERELARLQDIIDQGEAAWTSG
jgi:hypothetical protein